MRDRRDLRDPTSLGKMLLSNAKQVRKTYGKDIQLTAVYDIHVSKLEVPSYSGELSGAYTADRYKKELAARDDVYAKSTLKAIRQGVKPSDRPTEPTE